jgi:cysteine desulfurase family protein (TIGR01976 family)
MPTTTMRTPDVDAIRKQFPTLAGETAYLDNAGGSQVPACVADAVRDYMLTTYVQLGADYAVSRASSQVFADAHAFIRAFMGGDGAGEVALGSSTTAMCFLLADAYARRGAGERNEVIIAETGHESNVGPWARLAERGWTVRTWKVDPDAQRAPIEALEGLLSERTRIVAFPHVSNVLGEIEDARRIARLAHDAGARVVVDSVAYAPHRAIDVRAMEADWCVYSTYKVYGPHMAALFGTHEAFAELEGPNHFFIPKDAIPYKFELGGASHEGCAGLLALRDYLATLAGVAGADAVDRAAIERAFEMMTALELPLQARLVEYLAAHPRVRLVGPATSGRERVATVSFVHETKSSREIAQAANAAGLGIRFGHFYAYRLCVALGLEPDDGVVRTSLVHYNTTDEVERLIAFFERAL